MRAGTRQIKHGRQIAAAFLAIVAAWATTAAAQNADPALDKVRAGAAQHSNITEGLPDLSDETRFVPAKGYSPAHGAKGQQAPLASIGKASLPSKLGASADDSAARRASEIKAGQ